MPVGTVLERHPDDWDLEDRLDELIPPSPGPFKTFAVSAFVVSASLAVTVLAVGGYAYPRPTFGTSFGSASYLEVDRERGAVSAEVMLPNNGGRAVRVTAVEFDGPGAELVDVGVILEPVDETQTSDADEQAATTTPLLPRGDEAMALPATVPAGRTAMVVVWFRPIECVDAPGPWGTVDVTVDFGEGAFPPFSNTVSLEQDSVAFIDPDATADNNGELMMLRASDGSFSEVSGPLAGACEALR